MNEPAKTTSTGGIGFGGALAIVFITLKLCGVIGWSWLWVLAPLWIPLAMVLVFCGGCLLMAGLMAILAVFLTWKAKK